MFLLLFTLLQHFSFVHFKNQMTFTRLLCFSMAVGRAWRLAGRSLRKKFLISRAPSRQECLWPQTSLCIPKGVIYAAEAFAEEGESCPKTLLHLLLHCEIQVRGLCLTHLEKSAQRKAWRGKLASPSVLLLEIRRAVAWVLRKARCDLESLAAGARVRARASAALHRMSGMGTVLKANRKLVLLRQLCPPESLRTVQIGAVWASQAFSA